MEFEFDPSKSAANRDKHGMDFVEAQELWEVPAAEKPVHFPGEKRFFRIGRLGERFWTAVFTLRGDKVRLISMRRARRTEVADYERTKEGGIR